MLTIVMLLSSSKLLLAQNNVPPSTGDELISDTTYATIPIYLIKEANAKMIERLYLIEVNELQDSIIKEQNKYINEYSKTVDELNKRLIDANNAAISIQNNFDKIKKRNKVITYSAIGVGVGLIFGILIK